MPAAKTLDFVGPGEPPTKLSLARMASLDPIAKMLNFAGPGVGGGGKHGAVFSHVIR
jgi:hypothetical protein